MFLLFSQYWVGVQKRQWSPHFSKQSIPGLFYLEPHRKVSAATLEVRATNFRNFTKNDQTVFKPWFFAEIWVSKSPGFLPGSPRGVYISRNDPPKQKSGKLHKYKWNLRVDPKQSFFSNYCHGILGLAQVGWQPAILKSRLLAAELRYLGWPPAIEISRGIIIEPK